MLQKVNSPGQITTKIAFLVCHAVVLAGGRVVWVFFKIVLLGCLYKNNLQGVLFARQKPVMKAKLANV